MVDRPKGFLNGKEIKAIREMNGASINAFVLRLRGHDADCTMDEYEDIEKDILCQSKKTENAIREIESMRVGNECTAFCYDECNKETLHVLVKKHMEYSIGTEMVSGDILVWECQECHDGWFEDDYEIEKRDAVIRKNKNHLLTGDEITAIRKKLNMRRSEFVDLINRMGGKTDVETYEEIESDYDIQGDSLDKVIRNIGKM